MNRTTRLPSYVFAGGGSAGHALPSIRVAQTMRARGHQLLFIGSHASIEQKLSENYGIPFHPIATGKFDRSRKVSVFSAAFNTLRGTLQARAILRRIRPSGVFSSGGFASVPVVLAARSLKLRRILTRACDLSLGMANRLCLPFATDLTCTFAATCEGVPKGHFVGPIVDPSILVRDTSASVPTKARPQLLVYGGSLGATAINEKLRATLPEILSVFDVLHVCGHGKREPGLDGIKGYQQCEYVMNFSELLKSSDLAICRAGSSSLWELISNGTPHLAIPLPLSVSRGDQIENCKYFERLGATRWMDQEEFLQAPLKLFLMRLLEESDGIREAMRSITPERPASETISDILQQ